MSEQETTIEDRNFRRYQWFVRTTALAIAIGLLWGGSVAVPALSPFIALAAWLATRTFRVLTVLGLVVTVIVLVHPRWFCRWLCPLGLCAEGASRLGRRWGRRPRKSTPLGQWILWLTLGGALFGWPLLLWLDPLVIFAGLFGLTTLRSVPAACLTTLPALAVLLLSLAWPHIWCGQLCPLGALQDLLSHPGRRWHKRAVSTSDSGLPLARRAILGAAVGAASASALRLTGTAATRPLRPPGAIAKPEFLTVCVRCGNCIRVCPTRIIEPDLGRHGLTSLMSPVLHFQNGYCREDCTRCTRVCPSGALTPLTRKFKRRVRIGLPQVDMNVCLLGEDRECSECRRWCPYDAIRYVFSETEYCLIPQIDPAKCNGCGACEMACPVKPKKAIVVVPLG